MAVLFAILALAVVDRSVWYRHKRVPARGCVLVEIRHARIASLIESCFRSLVGTSHLCLAIGSIVYFKLLCLVDDCHLSPCG